MRTGVAHLLLHGGSCPAWLFPRMKKMAGAISEIIVYEYGQDELLRRLSDPFWFQAFGCVLGFDWHSSGLTTTVTGALKEALNEANIGVRVAGGKGRTSRKAPEEIVQHSDSMGLSHADRLVYASKLSAKVDNAAVQDSYQLYHHAFVFTENGTWAVVQQGMNASTNYARRYHWFTARDFVDEPHSAICGKQHADVLDMTAHASGEVREISVDLVNDGALLAQTSLNDFAGKKMKTLAMHAHHGFTLSEQTRAALRRAYEIQPKNYEELVALPGIGPKAVRALALVSELVYGAEASRTDPAKFSFAHGGKDGIPYPVDRELMDKNTEMLGNAVRDARLGDEEKIKALRRLHEFAA